MKNQKGSVLLLVLMIGIILMMIATVTYTAQKNSTKMSGDHRKSFEALQAADAGVVYFQSELNSTTDLCSGFFTKADSTNIASKMITRTVTLPNKYGQNRKFTLSDFKVMEGVYPMGVSFISTGYAPENNSKRSIKASVRIGTLGDYSAFVEKQQQTVGSSVIYNGKIFSDTLILSNNAVFNREVYYGSALLPNPIPPGVIFNKGFPKKVFNPFVLDRIYIDDNAGSICGAHTYKDLAVGSAPGEGIGFSYTGSRDIFISLDKLSVGSVVSLPYYEVDTSYDISNMARPPLKNGKSLSDASPKGTWTVETSKFNGVVYVKNNVYIEGTLKNYALTLACGKEIFVTNNIHCIGNVKTDLNKRVTLGLLSKSRFHFWGWGPSSLVVEAMVVVSDTNWWWGASEENYGNKTRDRNTHLGRDTSGNYCNVNNANCWYLRMLGGSITKRGNGIGNLSFLGGKRNYDFDPDNIYSPPPYFPVLYGKSGRVDIWEILDWGE